LNDKTLGYTIMAATILIMAGYFVWSFAPWLGASFAWLIPKKVRQLNVTGTRDIITVDYITQQITVENNLRLTQPHLPYREPAQHRRRRPPLHDLPDTQGVSPSEARRFF